MICRLVLRTLCLLCILPLLAGCATKFATGAVDYKGAVVGDKGVVGEAAGAAIGGRRGAVIGAASGGLLGGAVHWTVKSYTLRQLKSREEATQVTNYKPQQGVTATIDGVIAEPGQLRPGDPLTANCEYTILEPQQNTEFSVRETQTIFFEDHALGEVSRQMTLAQGTYQSVARIIVPHFAASGTYRVITTVSAVGDSNSSKGQLITAFKVNSGAITAAITPPAPGSFQPQLLPFQVPVMSPLASLREGPGVNFRVTSTASRGTLLTVLGETERGQKKWYKVRLADGRDAWVAFSSLRLTTEEIERYPTMEAPGQVVVGEEFTVQVSLTESVPTPGVRVDPMGESAWVTREGMLVVRLPPPEPGEESWPIDVVLSAPDFDFREAENSSTITLPRRGDSTTAVFHLRPKRSGSPNQPRRINANLYHNGTYLARITRTVRVTTGVAGVPPAGDGGVRTAAKGRPARLDPDRSPPDLTVFVLERVDGSGTAELFVSSPHFRGVARGVFSLPRDLPVWLDAQYDRIVTEVVTGPSTDRTIPLLRGFGRELYRRFAPPVFKDAFWRLRDQLGGDFQSIQIYSDNPLLPWELMRPSRPDGSDEEDFLGIDFRIARWHVSDNTGQLDSAPQAIVMNELVVVAPQYAAGHGLPSQQVEVQALETIRGFRRHPARLASFQALFQNLPNGIVHFAGHGVAKPGRAGVAEYLIRLEDSDLDVLTFRGLTSSRSGGHPFIFFNACSIGQAQRVANFVDGWAPAALEAGASGYVGGLWLLSDAGAAEFAVQFYRGFEESLRLGPVPVADLLRSVRRLFYERGDPTFLAYVYYGDPHFRFVAGTGN